MVRVHALRVAENLWRRSLTISRKLSGPTWVTLAVINAAIAVLSFWAYFSNSVPDSPTPPTYYVENNVVPVPAIWMLSRPEWDHRDFVAFARVTSDPVTAGFSMMVYGSNFQPRLNALAIRGFNPSNWRLPNPVASTRLVWQAPSNAPSLLTPVQQIVAIGVGIFTSFLSAISTFFAWQTYRRAKAQEILVQLQIAKLRAELAEYDEKARKKQAESGIILAT